MAQTLVSLLVHIVVSTKNHANLITPEIEPDLYKYISGTLRKMESPCMKIGGTANHLHLLVSQSKNIALAFLLEELKKSSSKWIKQQDTSFRSFKWQDGYGAFSIAAQMWPHSSGILNCRKAITGEGRLKTSCVAF